MLVLTRKVGQALRIAGDIVVIVKQVHAGRVTLGIEAPSIVKVLRTELVSQEAGVRRAK
ncbi:MAG: carbon storage regulator [Planctomycetes bacterium]|nr:carbon storage regulator [Planctomycetota bacterium]